MANCLIKPETSSFKIVPSSYTGSILRFQPLPYNDDLMKKTLHRLRYRLRIYREEKKDKDDGTYCIETLPTSRLSEKPMKFRTGSEYTGDWCGGMDGSGIYHLPDGTVYTGRLVNGLFAGNGMLMFPNGGVMKGYWIQGVLYNPVYIFQDGLIYKPKNWKYCRMPDRRYHSEIVDGLKPSGNIQYASDHPARAIPPGHYELVEGFYNPISKEVIHPLTGNVMRIASRNEQNWILKNCRREWEIPVPFNPYIYENWFPKINEGRHKYVSRKSLWDIAMNLTKERTGLKHRIYKMTKKKPSLLKEDPQNLIEIGSQMDRRNLDAKWNKTKAKN